jgi:hypothetical protein
LSDSGNHDGASPVRRVGVAWLVICVCLGLVELWDVFVRKTPALAIVGQHLHAAEAFGDGTPITQSFGMPANGLTAFELRVSAAQPATMLVRCELLRQHTMRPEPVVERQWLATIKRVTGVEWRRVTFPAIADSRGGDPFTLRLQLLAAAPADEPTGSLEQLRLNPQLKIGVMVSSDNVLGGGALYIGDRRQLGSLALRAYTQRSTAYERFRGEIVPTLPGVFKETSVTISLLAAYQIALATVLYAVLTGVSTGRS